MLLHSLESQFSKARIFLLVDLQTLLLLFSGKKKKKINF